MKYKNTMIEYLEQRKEERFERNWGMVGAIVASVILCGFILSMLLNIY